MARAPELDQGFVQLPGLDSICIMGVRFSGVYGGHTSQGSDFSFRDFSSQGVYKCVSGGVARDTYGETGRVSNRPGVECGPYRQDVIPVGTTRNASAVITVTGTVRQAVHSI